MCHETAQYCSLACDHVFLFGKAAWKTKSRSWIWHSLEWYVCVCWNALLCRRSQVGRQSPQTCLTSLCQQAVVHAHCGHVAQKDSAIRCVFGVILKPLNRGSESVGMIWDTTPASVQSEEAAHRTAPVASFGPAGSRCFRPRRVAGQAHPPLLARLPGRWLWLEGLPPACSALRLQREM